MDTFDTKVLTQITKRIFGKTDRTVFFLPLTITHEVYNKEEKILYNTQFYKMKEPYEEFESNSPHYFLRLNFKEIISV